jgi:hypothetical protein
MEEGRFRVEADLRGMKKAIGRMKRVGRQFKTVL